jgi:hypothetical protein
MWQRSEIVPPHEWNSPHRPDRAASVRCEQPAVVGALDARPADAVAGIALPRAARYLLTGQEGDISRS